MHETIFHSIIISPAKWQNVTLQHTSKEEYYDSFSTFFIRQVYSSNTSEKLTFLKQRAR
jgi:hypothetical protein